MHQKFCIPMNECMHESSSYSYARIKPTRNEFKSLQNASAKHDEVIDTL